MTELAPESVLTYATAGRAVVTLQSDRTGTHFTYRIQASKGDGPATHFVNLLTAPNQYSFLGWLDRKGSLRGSKRARVSESAPSFRALDWVLAHARQGTLADKPVRVMHNGRCGRCGRELTRPESLDQGLGPVCVDLA